MRPLNLNHASQRQHLSDDAEFAEDLAIRYADLHRGLHTSHFEGIAEYERARDECMAALFKTIANSHNVTQQEVRQSLGHRHGGFDFAVMLSFSLLYAWVASILAHRLYRLYGAGDGRATLAIMMTVASLLASIAGVMLGEAWFGILESIRIGKRASELSRCAHPMGSSPFGAVYCWRNFILANGCIASSERQERYRVEHRSNLAQGTGRQKHDGCG